MGKGLAPAGGVRYKRIADVVVGDVVLTWDEASGQLAPKRVMAVYRRMSDHLRLLTVRAGELEGVQELRTTDEHPFWAEDVGWVKAEELALGQRVRQADGAYAAVVGSVREEHPEGVPVYNVETEDSHTYFVAQAGAGGPPLLVHNCNPASVTLEGLKAEAARRGFPDPLETGRRLGLTPDQSLAKRPEAAGLQANANLSRTVPEKWQAEFGTLPDVWKNGASLKQRYLQHLQAEGENAKSPAEFARTTLRNWRNSENGASFEMDARTAMGAPTGSGSKPDKTGLVRPDLPTGEEFTVRLQGREVVTLRGVTDFKDKLRIFNDMDKNGVHQLEEMFNHAKENGVPMNLVISPRTWYLQGKVADFVRQTNGVVLQFDPVTGQFTQMDIGSTAEQAWRRPGS
jgi:hypothetical protein